MTDFRRRRGWDNLRTLARWIVEEYGGDSRDAEFAANHIEMELQKLIGDENEFDGAA